MPQTTFCRLCVSSTNEYKTLFDDNGQLNRIFKITVKYFDPILLISGNNHTCNVICVKCWQYINDFYGYQQWVLKSQAQLEFRQPILCLERLEDELFDRINQASDKTILDTESVGEEFDDLETEIQIEAENILPEELTKTNNNEQLELDDDLLNAIFDSDSETLDTIVKVSLEEQINNKPSNVELHTDSQKSDITSTEQPELNNFNIDNQQVTFANVSPVVSEDDISSNLKQKTALQSQVQTNRKEQQLQYDAFIAKWKGDIKCVLCKRQFATFSLLLNHFQLKHHDTKCYTICCGQKILRRRKFVEHLEKCHIGKTNTNKKCEFCPLSITDNGQLRKHMLKCHKDMLIKRQGKFKCEMCIAAFSREDNLRRHCSIKHVGYPMPEYNCNKCPMIYKSRDRFELHMKKHQSKDNIDFTIDNKPTKSLAATFKPKVNYICNICQRSFTSKRNISVHKRRAHDEKYRNFGTNCKSLRLENDALIAKLRGKLECDLCKKLFDNYTLLHRHFFKEHGGQKCHIVCCRRKFYIRSQIIRHSNKWHSEAANKSFKCLTCTAAFYKTEELRKHVVEMHKPNDIEKIKSKGRYYCDICLATFGKEPKLREHYRLKHAGCPLPEYSCKQCNLTFKTLHIREKHIQKEHSNTNENEILQNSEDSSLEMQEEEFQELQDIDFNNLFKHPNNNDENSMDIAFKEEIANEFQDLVNIAEQTQEKSQIIVDGNEQLNSNIDTAIIKEEISIYPSDVESETGHDILNINSNEELPIEFFTKSTSIKPTTQQYDAFIRKWKGDLECPKCPKEMFENFTKLGQHIRKEHKEKQFIVCCNLKLISRYAICAHLCLHLNPNAYQCNLCGKAFKTAFNLGSHKSYVHGSAKLCVCQRKSSSKEYDRTVCCKRKQRLLNNDAKIANLKKELECYRCKSKFPYFSLLHKHFRCDHHKEKFYIECCGSQFVRACEVIKHFLEH